MKRARPSTWMITSPPNQDDYLLTVNSDQHATHGIGVDFLVKVSDLGISLNELEFGEHKDWEVGVESLSAPNSPESFYTIGEKNESLGFFTLGFTAEGTGKGVYYFPTYYLPHKCYSPAELLAEIREKMTDMWRTTHRLIKGVNVVGELFSATMFDARINPISGFIELESVNVDSRPFRKMFRESIHTV